ncbi:unnamed protein product [Lymnaea stagnalis]|uniref:Uncharacterized protein n=1 Tax=Lymnaea stagnalis TaxID=6523 RepID=A0AAV2H689_LYMST
MASTLAHRLPVRHHCVKSSFLNRYFSSALQDNVKYDVSAADTDGYPPVKPKYPPGVWGNMNHKYAWKWFDMKNKMLSIPDVQGRLIALLEKDNIAMIDMPAMDYAIHNFPERVQELIDYASTVMVLDPGNDHPATLQFRQYVTKTCLLPWKDSKPAIYESLTLNNTDNLVNQLKQHISDHLLLESETITKTEKCFTSTPEENKKYKCQSLIRSISEFLTAKLAKDHPHLKLSHYDEDVIVRAFWSRYGIDRKKRKYVQDPDELLFDTVKDQFISYDGLFNAMLRSHLPLPQFENRESGLSVEKMAPAIEYKPSVYGQGKVSRKIPTNILAGHKLGDPCEFGLVGLISTCDADTVGKNVSLKSARDCRLALGITSTFSWLTAQANNQGFSHFVDLTYPLTSQTILTDGQNFTFLAYQLNTLELWKDDSANKTVNLCWHTDEMPLYQAVENGQVKDFNNETLQMLIKMFALAPSSRGYNMKPTITEIDASPETEDLIPRNVIVEEVVEEEKYIIQ